jgi:diguanylate cyclase (GGDEF)-like protein/PAS domain S-box-containing protein
VPPPGRGGEPAKTKKTNKKPARHVSSLLAYCALLSAAVVAVASLAIGLRERFSRVSLIYMLEGIAILGWQIPIAIGWLRGDEAMQIAWINLSFGALITGHWSRWRGALVAVWGMTALLTVLHLDGKLFVGVNQYAWGVYPAYGGVGAMFIALTVCIIGVNLYLYYRQFRDNRPGSIAARRALLLGTSLVGGAFAACDFLPTFGADVLPIGGLGLMSGFLVNAYTTWRYRLVEITPAYAAHQLMNSMSDGVLMVDRDGVVRLANASAAQILGIDHAQLQNRLPPDGLARDVLGWESVPFFPEAESTASARAYVAPNGDRKILDAEVALMNEPGHGPDVALVTLRDVTGAMLAQEQIERLAYFDPLTHLPNRRQLHERFQEAIATADRSRAQAAVLFLDLDRFKRINDTLGHDVGDLLLKAVAERISACVRETDWVTRSAQGDSVLARLGGDEFVLLLTPLDKPDGAARVATRIREALARPFVLKRGGEVRTGASIGISIYPTDGADEATLMKKADLAMYRAKEAGRNMFQFHDDAMNQSVVARSTMETGLRQGLARNQFLLHYQPLVACASGAVAGVDAQLYWRHPKRGLLPASAFIAGSEDLSVVLPLTQWLVHCACIQLRAWAAMGLPALYLMLTVHPAAAERGNLVGLVTEAIGQAGIDGSLLMLGLSREQGARDLARVRETLSGLHALGVRIVLDELSAGAERPIAQRDCPGGMVRLPYEALEPGTGPAGAPRVGRALCELAHALDLGVVVQGVETAAHMALARAAGCDLAQGAAFGAAVAAEDVPQLLSTLRKAAFHRA